MNDDRLPKIIFNWDKSLGLNTWVSEVKHIAATLGLPTSLDIGYEFDLSTVYNKLLSASRQRWHLEAGRKPKLRTFLDVHNFENIQALVKSNITRYQRSLISQLKFGILPLKIETDRYQGIPLEDRLCKLCNLKEIEDCYHFMFRCPALNDTRQAIKSQLDINLDNTSNPEKLSLLLDKQNINLCGKFIESLYRARQNIVYE